MYRPSQTPRLTRSPERVARALSGPPDRATPPGRRDTRRTSARLVPEPGAIDDRANGNAAARSRLTE